MSKVEIRTLESVTANDATATALINSNFEALQQAIENTVSRDGTVPNYMDSNLDLNSHKIINAGNPENDHDVITKKYFEDSIGDAASYATQAVTAANAAASSAQSAAVSASEAISTLAQAEAVIQQAAQDAAEAAEDSIEDYVENTVKPDIQLSVDAAASSASDASTYKTDAQNASIYAQAARDLAQAWATKMTGTVDGSEYSSKYYAQLAQEIYDRIGTVIKIIGRVNTVADLPASGNTNGDCYLVGLQGATDFDEYYWLNDHWEFLGTTAVTLDFASIEGSPTDNTALASALNAKQDTLVSGTNIKTLNGSSILGSGDLELSTYHPTLFTFQWSDCLKNDVQWLRADTFSWQSGTVYEAAYEHLVDDIDGKTAQTETIGSYTITFYEADDGHKIVLANQETTVQSIYAESGVAWYYILDTANTRFKLPRTKYGFVGLRDTVEDYVPESLPNVKGGITSDQSNRAYNGDTGTGALYTVEGSSFVGTSNAANRSCGIFLDASLSSSTYQDDAPVQQRATQMYLYFYVGSFTQTALENTAGLNAELFIGKADVDLSNAASNASVTAKQTIVGWGKPDFSAEVSISSPYTPTQNGFISISVTGAYSTILFNVDGVNVITEYTDVAGANQEHVLRLIPVIKGKEYSWSYTNGTLTYAKFAPDFGG